jgi:hypothetical protein
MSLVDGNDLSTWEGGLFDRNNEDSVSLLFRLLWIFTQGRAEGMGLGLNEAGRPFGVFSDIDVGRNRGSASQTASGRSTVCYQYGRYLLWVATGGREGTPSAANPYSGVYASQHTRGLAADIDASNYGRLDQLAARVGMKRTISSEIWHYEIFRNPDPDIDFSRFSGVVNSIFGGTAPAGGHGTPIQEDDMYDAAAREELIGSRIDKTIIPLLRAILAALGNDDAQIERILDALRRESRPRVYQIKAGEVQASRAAAIDVDEGYFRSYGSAEELANDKRLSLVAPELLQVTKAEFDDLEKRAKARLAELVADPAVPEVAAQA